LEIDINNLNQQRSECQRLQAEATKKPAAKTVKPNDDGDKKMPAKETKSGNKKPATKKAEENDEDTKTPASTRSQRPSTSTPTATGTAATSDILPSIEHLTEEEKELISNHIIPWLSYNDITLSDDGTFYSDSIISPVVHQWLIRRGVRPAAAPPSVQ